MSTSANVTDSVSRKTDYLIVGADALVVCTEWDEFKKLDLEKLRSVMAHPTIIDGRNLYDPKRMADLGFTYKSIGR